MAPPTVEPDFIPDADTTPDFIPDAPAGAATSAAAAPQPQGLQHVQSSPSDVIGLRRGIEEVKGAIKGAAQTGAGILDVANRPFITPTSGDATTAVPEVRKFTDWIRSRTQPSNLEQQKAMLGESMAEFLFTVGEGEAGPMASYLERAGFTKNWASFADKYPKLASALKVAWDTAHAAAKGGFEQGAQTAVKTGGDQQQTIQAAKTGALTSAAITAPVSAVSETASNVSRAINEARPGTRTIAGANFETQPGTNDLLLRNLKGVTQDPATQATDEALGNIAKTGVVNSINRTNAARAPEAEVIPPSRRLPGATSAPGVQMGETPTPEPTGGEILLPARKKQIGTIVRPGTGPAAGTEFDIEKYGQTPGAVVMATDPETGELIPPANPPPEGEERTDRSYRQPQFQYQTETRPGAIPPEGPRTDVVGGPGQLILKDGTGMSMERARAELNQREQILNDPDAREQMGARNYDDLQSSTDDLREQLRRYDDFAASQPHFTAPNPVEIARNTSSLSEAADHLKATNGRFWDAADKASGGQFSELRDEEKRLQKQIYGPNPTGKLDDLRAQLSDVQQRMMDFFDQYRSTVSPQEWDSARSGYQDGIVLQNLDNMLQKQFNGITRPEEARGLASGTKRQRVFDPSSNFNNALEDFYNTGFRNAETNRQVLERTIGTQGMDSLKDLGLMFSDAKRMDAAQNLRDTIVTTIRKHYHGARGMLAAGDAAALYAHQLGAAAGLSTTPLLTGTVFGARRYVLNRLIADPSFLKSFQYAVDQAIPPRTAGAMLAARMIAGAQNARERVAANQPPRDRLIDNSGRVVADETPQGEK